jgi:hypothetical protein
MCLEKMLDKNDAYAYEDHIAVEKDFKEIKEIVHRHIDVYTSADEQKKAMRFVNEMADNGILGLQDEPGKDNSKPTEIISEWDDLRNRRDSRRRYAESKQTAALGGPQTEPQNGQRKSVRLKGGEPAVSDLPPTDTFSAKIQQKIHQTAVRLAAEAPVDDFCLVENLRKSSEYVERATEAFATSEDIVSFTDDLFATKKEDQSIGQLLGSSLLLLETAAKEFLELAERAFAEDSENPE